MRAGDPIASSISAIQIPTLPLLSAEATVGAKIAQAKPLQAFPVTVVIAGRYDNIKEFLTGLLSLRRVTAIQSISIKQFNRREENDGSIQASIALQSYYTTQ